MTRRISAQEAIRRILEECENSDSEESDLSGVEEEDEDEILPDPVLEEEDDKEDNDETDGLIASIVDDIHRAQNTMTSRNGTLWSREPFHQNAGRQRSHNIVTQARGPTSAV